jgi:hypothetical protein
MKKMFERYRDLTVSIDGDIWQPNATRIAGPKEISHHTGHPDLMELAKDYERRHGECSCLRIEVVK